MSPTLTCVIKLTAWSTEVLMSHGETYLLIEAIN